MKNRVSDNLAHRITKRLRDFRRLSRGPVVEEYGGYLITVGFGRQYAYKLR